VADTVRKVKAVGKEQYRHFVEERLEKPTKPVTDAIPKNKLPLFSRPPVKSPSKQQMQLAALKNDYNLFSSLYTSCQTRDGDLDQFFSHVSQATPPSLSNAGRMQLGTKAHLLHCVAPHETDSEATPVIDAAVLDGACTVQMLNPSAAKTFQDYADSLHALRIISTRKSKMDRCHLGRINAGQSKEQHSTEERKRYRESSDCMDCHTQKLERLSEG